MPTGFLDRLRTPGYSYQPVGRLRRPPLEEEYTPRESVTWGPSPLQQGMINQVGSRGMFGPSGQQNEGPSGIQNITGFGQEAPNVVYDQRPEQFEKDLKLRKEALRIQEKQVDMLGGLKNFDAETRRMNAGTAAERNEIARFRANNPNMVIKASAGGNYFAIDPQSGQVVDTGIAVGNMTQEGAINLRQTGAENIQTMRGQSAENVANINATSRQNVADNNAAAAMERIIAQLQGQPQTPTPNETVTRAQEYINTHPGAENWIKISKDGKGIVVMRPKSQVGSGQNTSPNQNKSLMQTLAEKIGIGGVDTNTEGPEMSAWQDANKFIYEPRRDLSKMPFMANGGRIDTPFMTQTPTINAGGRVQTDATEFVNVMDPKSKKVKKIPKNQLEAALAAGGQLVQ